jgi:hypothetical protein
MTTILNVRNATNDEWDEMWQSCEYATYYHSREWAELWQSYTDGSIIPDPKIIIFSDGVKVVLPIMSQNYYGKIIKRYGLVGPPSEVNAKYGNWLTTDALTDDHITLLTDFILSRYNNLIWQLNPYDGNSEKVSVNSRYSRRKSFIWYMIDLTKGEKQIFSDMKQSCRNKISQALNHKLTVRESTGIEDWRKYYNLYQSTLERWGKTVLYVFDWKFFELLHSTYNQHVKLWLTWYNDIPVSGCICFYSNRSIFLFQSASMSEYRYLRPVNLEKYILIKDGLAKGLRWLDLGTAGKNKGLQDFKKSFGPEEKMCDMIFSWHPIIYTLKQYMR